MQNMQYVWELGKPTSPEEEVLIRTVPKHIVYIVHVCMYGYTHVTSCHDESPQCEIAYERLQLATNEKYPGFQYAMLHTYMYVCSILLIFAPHCPVNSFYLSTVLSSLNTALYLIFTFLTSTSTHSHIYFIFPPPLLDVHTHHCEGCCRREPGGSERGL